MVVGQHHHHRVGVQGVLHDPAHVQAHAAHVALPQLVDVQLPALGVQAELVHDLLGLAGEQVPEKFADAVGGVEHRLVGGGGEDCLAVELRHQLEQHRRVAPQAGHPLQLRRRGGEHRLEAAEAVDKLVGDGIGVLAGHRVVEQHLQQLVVGKGVRPAGEKLLPLSVPVPIVYAHGALPSAGRGRRVAYVILLYHTNICFTSGFGRKFFRVLLCLTKIDIFVMIRSIRYVSGARGDESLSRHRQRQRAQYSGARY